MGGGKEEKVVTKNEPWAQQIPYLVGGQIAPVVSQPVPVNADWLWWANQVAQTGTPIATVPAMSMNNPMLTGENVYGGQPNIFGESFHTTPDTSVIFPTYAPPAAQTPVAPPPGALLPGSGVLPPQSTSALLSDNWYLGAQEG